MAHRKDSLVIRTRVDFRTTLQKATFLRALKQVATVGVACELAGIGRQTAYDWRRDDPDFAKDWDNALTLAFESLESATYLKLAEVLKNPKQRISPAEAKLIELFLAGNNPEKYRQKTIEIDNSNTQVTIDWSMVPDEIMQDFSNGKLTLQDVYDRTIRIKEQESAKPSAD